jgi:hypothetical protein
MMTKQVSKKINSFLVSQNACLCFLKCVSNFSNDEKKILMLSSEGLLEKLFNLAKRKP